jgi:hypothetical protein
VHGPPKPRTSIAFDLRQEPGAATARRDLRGGAGVTRSPTATTSGAEFLDDEALEAAREDRDECDRTESDEMLVRALEDGVQPPVAAQLWRELAALGFTGRPGTMRQWAGRRRKGEPQAVSAPAMQAITS